MRVVVDVLEEKISAAMRSATGREDCTALVKPAADPKFGDYQANGVMALAKRLKTNPRQLAERIVGKLEIGDMCEPPEIAGPATRQVPSWAVPSFVQDYDPAAHQAGGGHG